MEETSNMARTGGQRPHAGKLKPGARTQFRLRHTALDFYAICTRNVIKASALVAVAALLPALAGRGTGAQTQQPTTVNSIRPESRLSKVVVFITVELKAANASVKPAKPLMLYGTGFLLSMPDSRLPKDVGFGYLVTNRHVAEAIEQDQQGNCVAHEVQQTYVTMNLKEPIDGNRIDREPIHLSQQVHWYFPKDEGVDLAVIPFAPAAKYDATPLSTDTLITAETLEKQNIVPGDRLLTVGYFYAYAGLHEIQPILREGVLAMLPDGPMTTTTCKSGDIYLADVHITPGNSGSPIFIVPVLGLGAGEQFGGVPNVFGLLGVVSGYMQETSSLTLRASTTWEASVQANSGVSVVVPAQKLKDLLDSPELQRERNDLLTRTSH